MTTTTAGTPATATRTTYPVDWLRGLAALAVVLFHAYQRNRSGADSAWPWSGTAHQLMTGTDLFVDLFFVLSGLVLWAPIARAAAHGEPARPGRVLLYRRMARLVPLYLVVVLVVWAVTNPSLPGQWQDLALHLTFTHVYSDTYIFWTNGPAWSLAVEFHFYVLMALTAPLLAAGVRRARTRRARLAVAAVLPAVLVVTTAAYLAWATIAQVPHDDWSVWFSPLARAADFGIGMGLALLAASGVRLGRTVRGVLAVVGTAATAALVLVRPLDTVGEWWHPAYAFTIAVALASIVLHDGPWPAALSWRPLAWLGGLGYGIYLIHEPVMRLLGHLGALPEPRPGSLFVVTAVLVVVPTIALAWVSSRTVEAAGLRLLRTQEGDGSPRDYYGHLREDDPARQGDQVTTAARAPAGAPR